MNDLFDTQPGATPLTDEDIAGLIPTYLSTRSDLNLVEAENILKAKTNFLLQANKYSDAAYLLQDKIVRTIHKAMYGDVWKWAGFYRTHFTNIGVPPEQIPEKLRNLLLNTEEQLKHCDKADRNQCDELAIRFHWSLVRIHPFVNGNGRHARQMADLLIEALGHPSFSWGSQNLVTDHEARDLYITALQKADETLGDVDDLVAFARS